VSTLWLEFWTEDDDFCMYAAIDEEEREERLRGQTREIVKRFDAIYDILENKKNREEELRAALDLLSQRILAPFANELKRCDLVRFIVFEDLIRCAFDLLLFEGTHLFFAAPGLLSSGRRGRRRRAPDRDHQRSAHRRFDGGP
jgi:hypothetical protein